MPNRILGCEIPAALDSESSPALEDVLMHEIRMLPTVGAQTCYFAIIEKFHGALKGSASIRPWWGKFS